MIDIKELELHLEKCLLNEDGKPFNRFTKETKSEMAKISLDNTISLNKEIEEHKNELVIYETKIVRLEDVIDGTDDYYWIYDGWRGETHVGSCVGTHIRLKGFLPDGEYNRLVYNWNLNNVKKSV